MISEREGYEICRALNDEYSHLSHFDPPAGGEKSSTVRAVCLRNKRSLVPLEMTGKRVIVN